MEQKKDGMFFNAFEGLLDEGGADHGTRKRRKKKALSVDPQQEAEDRHRRMLDELVVMGYESHLFRNDRQAESVERGAHLIPWMGQTDLLIDRYDARALLTDRRLFDRRLGGWDKKKKSSSSSSRFAEDDPKHAREQLLERKLERERYWDMALHTEDLHKEEERKRQKMGQAAYGHVALDYGDITRSVEEEEKQKREAEERKKQREAAEAKRKEEEEEARKREEEAKYEPPYTVPSGIIVPVPKKVGLIIEKTANFLFRQGPQAVNKLREQQKDNPTFLFLSEGHPLNPYLTFFMGKLEEAKKREEGEREKAQEFALSLVSDYNDEEEPFKQNTEDDKNAVTTTISSGDASATYIALYDFTPEKEGEMSMKAGELLTGLGKVDDWLQIERDGQIGYVPHAWVRQATQADIPKSTTSTTATKDIKPADSTAAQQLPEDEQEKALKMKRMMRAKLLAQLLTTGKEDIVQQLSVNSIKKEKPDEDHPERPMAPSTPMAATSRSMKRSRSRTRSRSRSRGRSGRRRRERSSSSERESPSSSHKRRRRERRHRGRHSSSESSSRSRSRSRGRSRTPTRKGKRYH